jgi:hypothetical protein
VASVKAVTPTAPCLGIQADPLPRIRPRLGQAPGSAARAAGLRQAGQPPDRPRFAWRRAQRLQDRAVDIVKLDHSGRLPSSLMVETSISASISAIWGKVRMRSR